MRRMRWRATSARPSAAGTTDVPLGALRSRAKQKTLKAAHGGVQLKKRGLAEVLKDILSSFCQALQRGACGEEHACMCAQCLEAGLLTQAPSADPTDSPDGRFIFFGGFGYYGGGGYGGGGGGYIGNPGYQNGGGYNNGGFNNIYNNGGVVQIENRIEICERMVQCVKLKYDIRNQLSTLQGVLSISTQAPAPRRCIYQRPIPVPGVHAVGHQGVQHRPGILVQQGLLLVGPRRQILLATSSNALDPSVC